MKSWGQEMNRDMQDGQDGGKSCLSCLSLLNSLPAPRPLFFPLLISSLIGWLLTIGAVRADATPDSTDVSGLIRALGGGDVSARTEAVHRLAGRGQEVIPDLEEVVAGGSWWAREGAMEALAGMGKAGLPALVRAVRGDGREEVRRYATRMIGRVRCPEGRDVLLGLMEDARVRSVAAAALGEMGDSAAVPVLTRALDDRSRSARRASAVSLGKLRDPRAVRPLIRLIEDPHQSVRFAAAGALAGIGPPSAEALSGALRRPDPLVRALSVDALCKIGGPEVVPAIAAAVEDPDWGVRAAAARGLGLFGDSTTLSALRGRLERESDRFVAARLREAIQKIEK